MDLQDRVVIVTGASGGIGLATARLLIQKGARVAMASRSKEKLELISKELPGSLAVRADMTHILDIRNMVKQTMERFGRIDALINNAGQGYDTPVEKIDADTFHHIFDLDVLGPVVAMQQVIPIMRKQGGGAIINISSGLALMRLPNMSAYASLKRAITDISLTAREELKGDGIVVSVVYPYITLTDFEKNTIKEDYPQEWEDREEQGGSGWSPPSPDTAEYIAQKIVEGIESGEAEIFAHDWMRGRADNGHA